MIGAHASLAVFLIVPLFCAWALVDGFRKGGIVGKGHRYYRADSPVQFWIVAGLYSLFTITFLALLGYIWIHDYLRS